MPAAQPGGQARAEAERIERLAREDPLYEQALVCVQQGRWAEAEEALAELQVRYAGSAAVRALWEALPLHLSAERSWGVGVEARPRPVRKGPSLRMRVLVVANVVLYMLVLLVWLLLRIKQLLG